MYHVKVNVSLAAAQARLRNVVEERDQFYEANDQIVTHLKSKVGFLLVLLFLVLLSALMLFFSSS